MKTINYLIVAFLVINFSAHAQYQKAVIDWDAANMHRADLHPKKSTVLTEYAAHSSNLDRNLPDWNQNLVCYAKIHELPENVRREIADKTSLKIGNQAGFFSGEPPNRSAMGNPILGVNFAGNVFGGITPPDNSVAISNGGIIVSVVNSNIEYYGMNGNKLYSSSFANFFNDPSLTGMLYDPAVLYDSGSDRFFMVVLHTSTSSTSKVLVCFSKTNDPNNGWWYYKLTGNPLGNSCWFDYPKIGVSNNEVYVTGNLFSDNSTYNQSVIYQIPKAPGYAGGTLNWQYWYNITNSPFTIVPVSWGQSGNYGPGIYLVSTAENGSADKIYLFEITDDMSGSPSIDAYSVTVSFALGGNALQKGTSVTLNTDDTRALSGFYLNGIIHFVFHSERTANYYGVNYNRLTVSPLSNWSVKFGLDGFDYVYPSVASFGTSTTDRSVMISFSRSGSTIYPEARVVFFDDAGVNSSSTLVKEGETFADVYQSSGVTRWGDYSGIARKQNSSSPQVWLSGCYGAFQSGEHALNTWIGQVTGTTTGVQDNSLPKTTGVKVFPNPAIEIFSLEFSLDKKSLVEISLTDVGGKLVKLLLRDMAREGKNIFSFNKGALSSGIYFLKIQTDQNIVKHEKIIIE